SKGTSEGRPSLEPSEATGPRSMGSISIGLDRASVLIPRSREGKIRLRLRWDADDAEACGSWPVPLGAAESKKIQREACTTEDGPLQWRSFLVPSNSKRNRLFKNLTADRCGRLS